MRLFVAKHIGFCSGVERAYLTIKRLLVEGRRVVTDGDVVHNPQVMEELKSLGLLVSKDAVFEDAVFAVRAHGIPQSEYERVKRNFREVVDLTCPIVLKLFEIAKELSKEGKVVVFGKENHPEMVALKSHVPGALITLSPQKVDAPEVVFLSQTTSSIDEYKAFVAETIRINDFKKALMLNTICPATILREREVEELSKNCDVSIVVGGRNSANTEKLVRIASKNGVVVWIEREDELPEDIVEYETVCVFSGTSTPNTTVLRVVEKLKEMEGRSHGIERIQ